MTPEQTSERASQAKRLRENKLLNEAFAAVEKRWLDALLNSEYGASDVREQCYRNLSAAREVKNAIFQWVQDGVIADLDLQSKGKR